MSTSMVQYSFMRYDRVKPKLKKPFDNFTEPSVRIQVFKWRVRFADPEEYIYVIPNPNREGMKQEFRTDVWKATYGLDQIKMYYINLSDFIDEENWEN